MMINKSLLRQKEFSERERERERFPIQTTGNYFHMRVHSKERSDT